MKLDLAKPVQCRNGRKAEVGFTDMSGLFPLAGRIQDSVGEWYSACWTKEGYRWTGGERGDDLVNVPEPKASLSGRIRENRAGQVYIDMAERLEDLEKSTDARFAELRERLDFLTMGNNTVKRDTRARLKDLETKVERMVSNGD